MDMLHLLIPYFVTLATAEFWVHDILFIYTAWPVSSPTRVDATWSTRGPNLDRIRQGRIRPRSGLRQCRADRNLQWAHARLHAPSTSTGKQSQGPRGGGRGHLIARGPNCYVLRARIPDSYRGVCIVVHARKVVPYSILTIYAYM